MRTRPRTVRYVQDVLSCEAFVAVMLAMSIKAGKSRKRKEYLRAIIRTWKADEDELDFIYFAAQVAGEVLFCRKPQKWTRIAARRAMRAVSRAERASRRIQYPAGGYTGTPSPLLPLPKTMYL